MGNCQEHFQKNQIEFSEIEEMQRMKNTVINHSYQTIYPFKDAPPNNQSNVIDNQRLHATVRYQQAAQKINIKEKKEELIQQFKEQAELEQLNYIFFYSLGLEDYHYHQITDLVILKEMKELVTMEQVDEFGVKYIGEWKKNALGNYVLYGNGILISNTSKYIGQFKDGLKHYHGREIFTKQVYEGKFEFGRRKGEGQRYTEHFVEKGIFDGSMIQGQIFYNNKNYYKGTLWDGRFHSKENKCIFIDNVNHINYTQAKYERGNLQEGVATYSNGNWYKGLFKNNCKHGKGIYTWKDGSMYDGVFAFDLKHGKGLLKMHKDDAGKQVEYEHGILKEDKKKQDNNKQDLQASQLPIDWNQ